MNRQYAKQSGFSLIELMLAMVIGLFLIGGVGTVFLSNQTTSRAKQDLDRTQENFRFGSNTLQRVVRQADGIQPSSTASELRVSLPQGSHNCIGGVVGAGGETNRFFVNASNELVCNINGNTDEVLLSGVTALAFAYGTDGTSAPEAANSVQVTLTVPGPQGGADQDISFFVALRAKLIAELGGASSGEISVDPPVTPPPVTPPPVTDPPVTDPPVTDPPVTDPPVTEQPVTLVSCKCSYKNSQHGWSVLAGSDTACTPACCQKNDTGKGNNRGFDFQVPSCK